MDAMFKSDRYTAFKSDRGTLRKTWLYSLSNWRIAWLRSIDLPATLLKSSALPKSSGITLPKSTTCSTVQA